MEEFLVKVRPSSPKKVSLIYFNKDPLKMMNNTFYFIFHLKNLFSFLRYLHFCPDFFGYIRKRFDRKAKENFKIYGFINWNTNNYNKHIVRHSKK